MGRRFAGAGLFRRNGRNGLYLPGGGPAPFDPSQIAGLEAWYRGDSYAGGTLIDLSGNGRHLTQADPDKRPTQVSRAGQLALSFDGTDDFLAGQFGSLIDQPYTIYTVHERPGLAATEVVYSGFSATSVPMLQMRTSDYRAFAGTHLVAAPAPPSTIDATCVTHNSPSSAVWSASSFLTPRATGSSGAIAADGLTLGAQSGPLLFFGGFIWDVILCSGAHDATTRAKFAGYFNARYTGLSIVT